MASRLVWLKVRLLLNGLRHDRQRRLGFPVLFFLLVATAAWAASSFIGAASGLPRDLAEELALWTVTLGWLAWVVMPVLFFPLDEPLDPSRLSLLPWSRIRLMAALAGSGLVTMTMLVPLAFIGTDLAWFFSPSGFVLQLAGALILLSLLVVGGQAFTGVVSLALRGRRGRDVAFMIVALMGLGVYATYQGISRSLATLGLAGALGTYPLSGWSLVVPPAAAQQVIVAAGRGDLAEAVVHLVVAGCWLAALTALWHAVIDHLVTTPHPPSRVRQRLQHRRTGARTPADGVFLKEIRFYLRDPRLRMVWTGGAVFLGLLVASLFLGTARWDVFRRIPWLTLAGPAVVLFIGLPVTLNQFGWERNAASFLFSLPMTPREVLRGKNRAVALTLLAEGAVMSFGFAAVSDGWRWLPYTVPIAVTAVGCQLAVGNVVSTLTPLRLPPMGTDLFAQATEQGCLALVTQALAFFVVGLMLIPTASSFIVVVAGYLDPIVVSVASVAWGGLVYWMGLALSERILGRRVPELIAAVETRV